MKELKIKGLENKYKTAASAHFGSVSLIVDTYAVFCIIFC